MSQKYDVVITSGGIGPTHDDVTIKAVAKALNQTIKCNVKIKSKF
jgi:molybdopterin-biosynthesis enzyme MoeA-like protein